MKISLFILSYIIIISLIRNLTTISYISIYKLLLMSIIMTIISLNLSEIVTGIV